MRAKWQWFRDTLCTALDVQCNNILLLLRTWRVVSACQRITRVQVCSAKILVERWCNKYISYWLMQRVRYYYYYHAEFRNDFIIHYRGILTLMIYIYIAICSDKIVVKTVLANLTHGTFLQRTAGFSPIEFEISYTFIWSPPRLSTRDRVKMQKSRDNFIV